MTSQHRPAGDLRSHQYRILKEADLRDYLSALPEVAGRLGGAPENWTVGEVGDGNLNLVFIVKGAERGVAVKQALPYVRAWSARAGRCRCRVRTTNIWR